VFSWCLLHVWCSKLIFHGDITTMVTSSFKMLLSTRSLHTTRGRFWVIALRRLFVSYQIPTLALIFPGEIQPASKPDDKMNQQGSHDYIPSGGKRPNTPVHSPQQYSRKIQPTSTMQNPRPRDRRERQRKVPLATC